MKLTKIAKGPLLVYHSGYCRHIAVHGRGSPPYVDLKVGFNIDGIGPLVLGAESRNEIDMEVEVQEIAQGLIVESHRVSNRKEVSRARGELKLEFCIDVFHISEVNLVLRKGQSH